PGQVTERTWTIGGGARLEGRIVDQHDAPVTKREVWLLKKRGSYDGYLDGHERGQVTTTDTSDEQGRFVLSDVAVGSWWLTVAPVSDQNAKTAGSDIAPKTQSIEITSASTQFVTLRVVRGLFVRGRVLDPEGKP